MELAHEQALEATEKVCQVCKLSCFGFSCFIKERVIHEQSKVDLHEQIVTLQGRVDLDQVTVLAMKALSMTALCTGRSPRHGQREELSQ